MKDVLPVGEVPERPYSIRDPEDHFSLINFLSDRLKRAVMELPEHMLVMDEAELKGLAMPTSTDYALRVSFWREFDKAMWRGSGRIVCASIFAGICSDVYFYTKFINHLGKFAWMIRPVQGYQKEMEAILYRGTERLWELMEVPIKNSKGQFDSKMAELLLKTIVQVENRVKGMAVQRKEARNLNLNVGTRPAPGRSSESLDSIDARIKQLEAEVSGEGTDGSGKGGASDNQALSLEAPKEEREIVQVGVLRRADPVPR